MENPEIFSAKGAVYCSQNKVFVWLYVFKEIYKVFPILFKEQDGTVL